MKKAWIFPGQGSQYDGFLHALPKQSIIQSTLEEASEILNIDIRFLGEAESLKSTRNVQLTMLTAGVATARAFLHEGTEPDYLAGHSVGAFAAAVTSDVLSFEDALQLVRLRGELMESLQDEAYGMAVIVGMPELQLLEIVEQFHTEQKPVYVSNRNAPQQLTLSGHKKAMQRVIDFVEGKGASIAKMLNVSTPSHCPLFLPVQNRLAAELSNLPLQRPRYPLIANRNARVLRNPTAIAQDLAESIALPVRWHDATSILFENGVRQFIEMPPGDVLKKLAQSAFLEADSYSVDKNGFSDCLYLAKNKGV
ncbi:ACP S-malonyltransferase [Solibacillus sp. FSL K6-1523]|uniref:ACP S-malonyltransferase n=1 Tax=Solibacillus sp. FSL K6-1523 TaxID=2921471 RepID=UPI0030FB1672